MFISHQAVPTWSAKSVSGGPPSARQDHTAVYAAAKDTMYVFGGYDGSRFNDVWALNLASDFWSAVTTNGGPPSARYGHTAVYATARGTMYAFGGLDGSKLNDVWALTLHEAFHAKLHSIEHRAPHLQRICPKGDWPHDWLVGPSANVPIGPRWFPRAQMVLMGRVGPFGSHVDPDGPPGTFWDTCGPLGGFALWRPCCLDRCYRGRGSTVYSLGAT